MAALVSPKTPPKKVQIGEPALRLITEQTKQVPGPTCWDISSVVAPLHSPGQIHLPKHLLALSKPSGGSTAPAEHNLGSRHPHSAPSDGPTSNPTLPSTF